MTRTPVRLAAAAAAATLTIGLAPATSATPATAVGAAPPPTVCDVEAFGRAANGRLTYRAVKDTRTTMVRTTPGRVGWTPLSWSLQSSESLRGRWERRTYLVPATDRRVRLVETFWTSGGTTMRVTVKKTVRWNVETRLVASTYSRIYNLAGDGTLQRRIWNGRRISKRTPLKVKLPGARAITVTETNWGDVIYVTDRKGQLHIVVPGSGAMVSHKVLRTTGYAKITGIKVGYCTRDALGLLQVNRDTGRARIQRHWNPAADDRRLGPTSRVAGAWTWRYLG